MNTNGKPQYAPEELQKKQAEWARGKALEKKACIIIASVLGALILLLAIPLAILSGIETAKQDRIAAENTPTQIPINMDIKTFKTRINAAFASLDDVNYKIGNMIEYGRTEAGDNQKAVMYAYGDKSNFILFLTEDDLIDFVAFYGPCSAEEGLPDETSYGMIALCRALENLDEAGEVCKYYDKNDYLLKNEIGIQYLSQNYEYIFRKIDDDDTLMIRANRIQFTSSSSSTDSSRKTQ